MNKKVFISMVIMFSFLCLTTYGFTNSQINVQAASKTTKKSHSMNLNKIKSGDYRSIKGKWNEVASYSSKRSAGSLQIGGTDVMKITNSKISGAGIKVSGDTLTDNNDSHKLEFKKNNQTLVATIKDEDASTNYSVTFYPKGTTTKFNENNEKNNQNLIAVWTSNNDYTEVFARGDLAKTTLKPNENKVENTKSTLNLTQISNNDFSSLVGAWKNPEGKILDITNQTENRPEGSTIAATKGAVVQGKEHDGYPEVITSGTNIYNGGLQGGIGTFDPEIKVSAFEPLVFAPKGQKITDNDDSDISKDRLIIGGGQAGFSQQAYYRN